MVVDKNWGLNVYGGGYPHTNCEKLFQVKMAAADVYKLYAVDNGTLYSFRSDGDRWKVDTQLIGLGNPLAELRHVVSISDSKDVILLKEPKGISMYVYENKKKPSLVFKSEDKNANWFNPNYEISFGNFYNDTISSIGLMTTDSEQNVKFYTITLKNLLLQTNHVQPLLNTNISTILNKKFPAISKIMMANLKKQPNQQLIARNAVGLNVFEFNAYNYINYVMQIPYAGLPSNAKNGDELFFPDLTGQLEWNDIALFNSSGMFVYGYANLNDTYKFITYNPLFSEANGWTNAHTRTVRFGDINQDGRDEIIFTGPAGIEIHSYDQIANKWKSLLSTSKLSAMQRHTTLLQVLPRERNSVLFSHHSGKFYWSKIVEEAVEVIEDQSSMDKNFPLPLNNITAVVPMYKPRVENVSTLYLRDTIFWSEMLDSIVNPATGKPKFVLPLIDDPYSLIKLRLFYDGSHGGTGTLGEGWSIPQNFIILDHQDSIFPTDESYFLVVDDIPHKLKLLPANSTLGVQVYTLEHANKVIVEKEKIWANFYPASNKWEIEFGSDHKHIYGSFSTQNEIYGAVSKELTWKNWRGAGFDDNEQVERVNMWYLGAVEIRGIVSNLKYDVVVEPVKGTNFGYTKEVYLKTMRSNETALTFSYHNKNASEYKQFPNQDKQGNYIREMMQSRFISGYKYTTTTKQQTVTFEYTILNSKRVLTSLKQTPDYTENPVMIFEYTELPADTCSMESLTLPTGVKFNFNYTPMGKFKPIDKSIVREITVSDNYIVTNGPDFTLVSYIDNDQKQVVLRMFTQDLSQEVYTSEPDIKWPLLGPSGAVQHYEILMGNSYFAVVAYSQTKKHLYGCGRHMNGDWHTNFEQRVYQSDSVMISGTTFVLISDPGRENSLIEWKQREGKWRTQEFEKYTPFTSIAVYRNTFAMYNDTDILLGYKKSENDKNWSLVPLFYSPGSLKATNDILTKFNLDTRTHTLIFGFFRNNALQISQNLIVLSELVIENDNRLLTRIKSYTIGRDYKVAKNETVDVAQDTLADIPSKEYSDNTYKYVHINGEMRIKETNLKDSSISRLLPTPTEMFLLNLKNYHVSLSGQILSCNKNSYSFSGVKWRHLNVTEDQRLQTVVDIPLGDKFIISKTKAQPTVRLLNATTNEMLFDFNAKNISSVQIHFPIYLASQESGKAISIVELMNGKTPEFKNTTLPVSEELSPYGSARTLITHEAQGKGKRLLIFRPLYGVRRFIPNYVVTQATILIPGATGGSKERVTGYVYDEDSVKVGIDNIYYEHTDILPGNNMALYGSVNITTVSVAYVNGKNRVVKVTQLKNKEHEEQEDTEEEINHKKASTLYGKDGYLEIAHFPLHPLASQMSGYIGFEDYENNQIGVNRSWSFKNDKIERGGFALTGQNYLHLDGGSMEGLFQPQYQHQEFVASCWIRTKYVNSVLNVSTVKPYLKAGILTANGGSVVNFIGKVNFQINDWFYMEVIVDLNYAHEMLKAANESQPENLQVAIRVGPMPNDPIDVDNVRFAPLNSNFDVNVYHPDINKPVALITNFGGIERRLFDKYQVEIAKINVFNQIEEFISYTKGSYNGDKSRKRLFSNPRSVITLKPEKGIYEDFSSFAFGKRWNLTEANLWDISPATLQHHTLKSSTLLLENVDIDSSSYAIRIMYSLIENNSLILLNGAVELHRKDNKTATIALTNSQSNANRTRQQIPTEGELLMVKEEKRVIVWIDGGLYLDEIPEETADISDSLKLSVQGEVKLQHVMLFSRTKVQVAYENALSETIQRISLLSSNTVIIEAELYDELGRKRITVQPVEVQRKPRESILAYTADFVTNDDPSFNDSVWKTGQLKGNVTALKRHPFGFSEVVYDSSPLNKKITIGLPGKDFSASGVFAMHINTTSSNVIVNDIYPTSENFTHEVIFLPQEVQSISVYNDKDEKVASFIHVPGNSRTLLSTFEYNENGLKTKILPPLYYEKVGIYKKTVRSGQGQDNRRLQERLGDLMQYDKGGNLVRKSSPDAGVLHHVYDERDLLRFAYQYSHLNSSNVDIITYFDYNLFGQVSNSGRLKRIIPIENVLNATISDEDKEEYQSFYDSLSERDPALRGRVVRSITMNQNDEPFVEESIVDVNNNAISKRFIISHGINQRMILSINKRYDGGGLLKEILYPTDMFGSTFRVTYEYDKLGRVISVGVPGQPNRFMEMTYNANNQLITEVIAPLTSKNFTRIFKYNEPGFLIEIDDIFLRQEVSYSEKAYGNNGYGDGRVARTKFTAKWHSAAKMSVIGLTEISFINEFINKDDSRTCFNALKSANYLDTNNQQTLEVFPDLGRVLPRFCAYGPSKGEYVRQTLGKFGFPKRYGFRFDHGNYMELTKAKYFVGNEKDEYDPLQPGTFAKQIPTINVTMSNFIWEQLKLYGYILEDNAKANTNWSHGKLGKSLKATLFSNLRRLNSSYGFYTNLLKKLITRSYIENQSMETLSKSLPRFFRLWLGRPLKKKDEVIAKSIGAFIRNITNPFDQNFQQVLDKFDPKQKRSIVKVLQEYFARQLGVGEFDVESFDIDANGNHKKYYTGFDRYELKYNKHSNQISDVSSTKGGAFDPFKVRHDSRGNVIDALHKNIKSIEYHPVSNRALKIMMTTGETIEFSYDSKGERVLKRVKQNDRIISELHYLRDERGRALVERKFTFVFEGQNPDVVVTMYIYGPKGLVGFVRRDQFYSVITDNQGSVRAVVLDGEVVAAYDYMPYGTLMRIYGSNPSAHISYRYTGQEWDQETGLYNYHARLYDPSIGRFLQIDPKMQYFSPYKYAGNAPISMVDPSGEFAILLLCLGLALLGAYLGGAAYNNSFNIAKWNFRDPGTYLHMVVGAVLGATLPTGILASAAFIGVPATIGFGVALAYVSASAANKDWNPANWDYSSPKTYNAAFTGFASGATASGAIKAGFSTIASYGTIAKYTVSATSVGIGLTFFTYGGIQTGWDIKSPEFWDSTMSSILGATDIPISLKQGLNFMGKNLKGLKNINYILIFKEMNEWKSIFKKDNLSFKNKFCALYQRQEQLSLTVKHAGNLLLLASNVLITFGFAFVLNGNQLNWEQPSTYFNLLSAIQIKNMVISPVKEHLLFKMNTNEFKNSQKAPELTNEMAKVSVDMYKKVLAEKRFDPKEYRVKLKEIKKGEIPNTAMSILITKYTGFVAFSSDNLPGLVLVFTHDNLSNPQFKILKELPNNKFIGEEKVKLREDETLNKAIHDKINNFQETLKKQSLEDYKKDNTREKLAEICNEIKVDGSDYIEIVENQLQEKGYADLGFLKETILSEKFVNEEIKLLITDFEKIERQKLDLEKKMENIKMQLKEKKEASTNEAGTSKGATAKEAVEHFENIEQQSKTELEKKNKNNKKQTQRGKKGKKDEVPEEMLTPEYKEVEEQLAPIKKKFNNLNDSIQKKRVDYTKKLIKEFENELKSYGEHLIRWKAENCAEAHVLSAYARQGDLFPDHFTNPTSYDPAWDVKYMATYRLTKPPEIQPFPRCANCMFTTSNIKYIITDIGFQETVKNLEARLARNKLEINRLSSDKLLKFNRSRRSIENENILELYGYFGPSDTKNYAVQRLNNEPLPTKSSWTTKLTKLANKLLLQKTNAPTVPSMGNIGSEESSYIRNNRSWNLLEFGDKLLSQIDINGTLLLVDVLLAKCGNRKRHVPASVGESANISFTKEQQFTCQLIQLYEESVRRSADASGIASSRLRPTDIVALQKEIHQKVKRKHFESIANLMMTHALKACPSSAIGSPGRLSSRKCQAFEDAFRRLNINEQVNGILIELNGLTDKLPSNLHAQNGTCKPFNYLSRNDQGFLANDSNKHLK